MNILVNDRFTTKQSPKHLMSLCGVPFGQIYEYQKAITLSASTLPFDAHSTKGCGSTRPDPKDVSDFSLRNLIDNKSYIN